MLLRLIEASQHSEKVGLLSLPLFNVAFLCQPRLASPRRRGRPLELARRRRAQQLRVIVEGALAQWLSVLRVCVVIYGPSRYVYV